MINNFIFKEDFLFLILSIFSIANAHSFKENIILRLIKKINEEIANRIQFITEKAKAWLGSLNCKIIEDLLGENDDPF